MFSHWRNLSRVSFEIPKFSRDFDIPFFVGGYIWFEKTLTLRRMEVMSDYRLSFLVGCLNWLIFFAGSTVVHENATEVDVAPRILSRPKRYLIFPQGSNFQVNIMYLSNAWKDLFRIYISFKPFSIIQGLFPMTLVTLYKSFHCKVYNIPTQCTNVKQLFINIKQFLRIRINIWQCKVFVRQF